MKPAELQSILDRLRLSQAAGARWLDLSDRTLRRYLDGSAPIPHVVDLALRYLDSTPNWPTPPGAIREPVPVLPPTPQLPPPPAAVTSAPAPDFRNRSAMARKQQETLARMIKTR